MGGLNPPDALKDRRRGNDRMSSLLNVPGKQQSAPAAGSFYANPITNSDPSAAPSSVSLRAPSAAAR